MSITLASYLREPTSDEAVAYYLRGNARTKTEDAILQALKSDAKPKSSQEVANIVHKYSGYVRRILSDHPDMNKLMRDNYKAYRQEEMQRIYDVYLAKPFYVKLPEWAKKNNTSVSMFYKARDYITG